MPAQHNDAFANLPQANALRAAFGIGENEPIQPERLFELVSMLLEFVITMDQLGWRVWREVAPNSTIKRPTTFKSDVAKFLAGDPGVQRSAVKQDLEPLRQILGGLISASRLAVEEFASTHADLFNPETIKAPIPKNWKGNVDGAACWDRYVQLAARMDREVLTREVLALWGAAAEKIIKGSER